MYTLEIRNNSQLNGLNVPDASLVPVKCTHDVLDLMEIGFKNRAVGATALNERSSRSHRYKSYERAYFFYVQILIPPFQNFVIHLTSFGEMTI